MINAFTFTFTFKAFSRCFYPKRLTISTFVIRSEKIYRRRYSTVNAMQLRTGKHGIYAEFIFHDEIPWMRFLISQQK